MAPEEPRRPVLAVVVVTAAVVLLVLAAVGLEVRAADGPAEPEVGDAGGAEAVLTRLQGTYQKVAGLRAQFVQTSSGASYLEPLVQTGTLAWKRPGRLRWDFQTPSERLYLSDGSTLWVVEPGERRCTVYREVDDSLRRFFSLLTGLADAREQFEVRLVGAGDELRDGRDVLELRPRAGNTGVDVALVRVDRKSGLVQSVVLVSPFGDRTETVLDAVRTDVDLPDASFRFARSDDYEWIEASLP